MAMRAEGHAGPFQIERHDSLPSTNDAAMRLARAGHKGGVWVVADEQTQGRGRLGRVWASPRGNLYASLLLIDAAPVARTPELGFVAGVALAEAINGALAGATQAQIKWPNDIVHAGAKLSGLMLEGASLADGRFACVIGFGVNCASHPVGLDYPAQHLTALAGSEIAPEDLLTALSRQVASWLTIYDSGAGFPAIRNAWLARAAGLGGPIRVRQHHGFEIGIFETIDDRGRLVLAKSAGRVHIEAGDVFLPTPPSLSSPPERPNEAAAAPPSH